MLGQAFWFQVSEPITKNEPKFFATLDNNCEKKLKLELFCRKKLSRRRLKVFFPDRSKKWFSNFFAEIVDRCLFFTKKVRGGDFIAWRQI